MEYFLDQEDGCFLFGIEWQISIDCEQVGCYQVGIGFVGNMVQFVINGVLIGKYCLIDFEDEVDICVCFLFDECMFDWFDQFCLQMELGLVLIVNFIDWVLE